MDATPGNVSLCVSCQTGFDVTCGSFSFVRIKRITFLQSTSGLLIFFFCIAVMKLPIA